MVMGKVLEAGLSWPLGSVPTTLTVYCLPGVRPDMVAAGELDVIVTGAPPPTGVAVNLYCRRRAC